MWRRTLNAEHLKQLRNDSLGDDDEDADEKFYTMFATALKGGSLSLDKESRTLRCTLDSIWYTIDEFMPEPDSSARRKWLCELVRMVLQAQPEKSGSPLPEASGAGSTAGHVGKSKTNKIGKPQAIKQAPKRKTTKRPRDAVKGLEFEESIEF